MKHLDHLLIEAFTEELENVLPTPVDKSAITATTFQKLGLEQPGKPSLQEEWAAPITRRRRPWAVLAACLALVFLAGAGLLLRPLLVKPASSLSAGTYLECAVLEASFDQQANAMAFTLEAKTDLDLDSPNAPSGYQWWYAVTFQTDVSSTSFEGGDLSGLTQWKQTGENTYRCEDFQVEMTPESQDANHIHGELTGTFSLEITSPEQDSTSSQPQTLTSEMPFTIDIPQPEGNSSSGEEDSNAATAIFSNGTYFECQVAEASFDKENWAVVLTLEASTDLALDSPMAASGELCQWSYDLRLRTEEGDISLSAESSGETLNQWTKTGENTYQSAPLTLRVDPDYQQQHRWEGSFEAILSLTAYMQTQWEGMPTQFPSEMEFTLDLPPVSQLEPPASPTYLNATVKDITVTPSENGQSTLSLKLELNTDLEPTHPAASDYYQWNYSLYFDGIPNVLLTNISDAGDISSTEEDAAAQILGWEKTGENTYESRTLTFSLSGDSPSESPIFGPVEGTFTLTCLQRENTDSTPKSWNVELPLAITLPLQAQPLR